MRTHPVHRCVHDRRLEAGVHSFGVVHSEGGHVLRLDLKLFCSTPDLGGQAPPAQEGWKAKDDPLTALGTLLPEEPGFPGWPPGDSGCIKWVKEGFRKPGCFCRAELGSGLHFPSTLCSHCPTWQVRGGV